MGLVRPQIDTTGVRKVARQANESDTGRVDANRSPRRNIVAKVYRKVIIPKHIAYSCSTRGMDIEGREDRYWKARYEMKEEERTESKQAEAGWQGRRWRTEVSL